MSVLITGGYGFVGLNVAERLLSDGEDVVLFGLGQLPEAARADFSSLQGTLRAVVGDVCDPAALDHLMSDMAVNRVVHGAAITAGPDRERQDPAGIVQANLMGTIVVLESARKHDVRRFLQLSSCAVYGESDYDVPWCDEETTLPVPVNLYAISKYAAERTALRFGRRWDMDVVVARPTEVFGPWERDTGARDTMSAPLQVTRLAVQGGQTVLPRAGQRDWGYSRDVARAIVALLQAENSRFDVYNVSSGVQWTITAWCDKLAEFYPGFHFRLASEDESGNVDFYDPRDRSPLAIDRLTQDIGFVPEFDLDASFEDYMSWISDHPSDVV